MSKSKSHIWLTRAILVLVMLSALSGCYVLSILWRVSLAEQELYGRSCLITLSAKKFDTSELGTPASFFDNTYSFDRHGKTIHVYKQLINSFQHAYGSALAAFELGSTPADLLFRANEYAEGIVCGGAGTEPFMLDARKDLYNNSVGREIGIQARSKKLNGADADKFIVAEILQALERTQRASVTAVIVPSKIIESALVVDDAIVCALFFIKCFGFKEIFDGMLIRLKRSSDRPVRT